MVKPTCRITVAWLVCQVGCRSLVDLLDRKQRTYDGSWPKLDSPRLMEPSMISIKYSRIIQMCQIEH